MNNVSSVDGSSEQAQFSTSANGSNSAPQHLHNPYQPAQSSTPLLNGFPAQAPSTSSMSHPDLNSSMQSNGIPLYPPNAQGLPYNPSSALSQQSSYLNAPAHAQQLAPRPSAGSFGPTASTSTSTPGPSSAPTATRGATPITAQSANVAQVVPQIPPSGVDGSPTRMYVNQKVTPALLEGMKYVASRQPDKPLKWLGEFLLKRSEELESASSSES